MIARGNRPTPEVLGRLSRALEYPLEFFFGCGLSPLANSPLNFVAPRGTAASSRAAAAAAASLGVCLFAWLQNRLPLPAVILPELGGPDPEMAARSLRRMWGLGERPLGNLTALVETFGIRVFSLPADLVIVGTFSFLCDDRLYICQNNFLSPEASRFELACAFGDLVWGSHRKPQAGGASQEFASALLMPEGDVRAHVCTPISSDLVCASAARWYVSAPTLLRRLVYLQMAGPTEARSLASELRALETAPIFRARTSRESSLVWQLALERLWAQRITKQDIANELRVPFQEVEELLRAWLATPSLTGPGSVGFHPQNRAELPALRARPRSCSNRACDRRAAPSRPLSTFARCLLT